jgi:type IV pilus assembly protein PilM
MGVGEVPASDTADKRAAGHAKTAPRRVKPLLGLDVGADAVKMVEVRSGRGKRPAVARFAMAPTPPGAVVDGQVADVRALAACVRSLLRQGRFRTRRVVVGLSGSATVLRHVTFPTMTRAELAEMLRWEAEKYLPIPRDEAQVDFAIVSQEPRAAVMTVMLVGANRRVVEGYVDVLRAARLKPVAVETDSIAVARALRAGAANLPDGGAEAGVDIGDSATKVTVVVKGVPQLARTVGFGAGQLAGPDEGAPGSGEPGAAAPEAEATSRRLHAAAPALFAETRRSLEFFTSQNRGLAFQRIALFGGGAGVPGLAEAFAAALAGLPGPQGGPPAVAIFRPGVVAQRGGSVVELGPEYVVAVGLALRGRGLA